MQWKLTLPPSREKLGSCLPVNFRRFSSFGVGAITEYGVCMEDCDDLAALSCLLISFNCLTFSLFRVIFLIIRHGLEYQ